ncbi:MAG: hypothetical protein ACJAWV_000422 [Flammeovirgaceae bacterium]|jgi:hypothetical protein
MARKFKKTLLIVCEGSATEPAYLEWYRKKALAISDWTSITIYPDAIGNPKPDAPEQNRKTKQFESNKKDKKQENRFKAYLQEIGVGEHYDSYKSEPTRFTAEAKLRKEEDGFDEVWAVFDEDDRPATSLKKAFELSQEGKEIDTANGEVNIAFSSRSFEHGLLLHFEQNNTAFIETACGSYSGSNNNRKKQLYNCGCTDNTDANDCKGTKCLVGYIRANINNDFNKSLKKAIHEEWMIELDEKLHFAFKHTAWLRHVQKKTKPTTDIWALKPYTNVDILVKSMLNINKIHHWQDMGIVELTGFKQLQVNLQDTESIHFTFDEITVNPLSTLSLEVELATGGRVPLTISEQSFEIIREQGSFSLIHSHSLIGCVLKIEDDKNLIWVQL